MNSTDGTTKKVCPKCKQVDSTTFSTCRNCGTRYDYKPEEKQREVKLGLPLIILIGALLIGAGAYQYQQMMTTYEHPDQLIGKTLKCGKSAVAATNPSVLLSMDTEIAAIKDNDPKLSGKATTGALDAASALNSISSGKETSLSIMVRYMMAHQIVSLRSDDGTPLSVKVVGTNSSTDKFRLVQVRAINGKHAGEVWWMNVKELDLTSK
jgi:ribosomal protein L40E